MRSFVSMPLALALVGSLSLQGCAGAPSTLLRLYSPTEAFFDKTWRPSDFEKLD